MLKYTQINGTASIRYMSPEHKRQLPPVEGLLIRLRDALKRHDGRLAAGGSTYGQPPSGFVDGASSIYQIAEAVRTVAGTNLSCRGGQ